MKTYKTFIDHGKSGERITIHAKEAEKINKNSLMINTALIVFQGEVGDLEEVC